MDSRRRRGIAALEQITAIHGCNRNSHLPVADVAATIAIGRADDSDGLAGATFENVNVGRALPSAFTALSPEQGQAVIMIIFDIPYSSTNGRWTVQVSNNDHPEFKTRIDAIRFAVDAALKAQQHGGGALITVEGVDGRRRAFDHEVKGVV